MRSDEIDMALSCSHQATHLVEEDDRFIIYAPAIMNAEVIAHEKDMDEVCTLGVGQQRQYLKNLAQKAYPQIQTVKEIKPTMLPYTLSMGEIDAAVMDVTKAALVPEFSFAPLLDRDYISYVLVVREDVIQTESFERFIEEYNRVIADLKNFEKLQQDIGMDAQFWEMSNIKFLKID